MKKIIGIAALIMACSPFAQAQDNGDLLSRHPDARNDRQPAELRDSPVAMRPSTHHVKHHVKHHRVVKHHRRAARHSS